MTLTDNPKPRIRFGLCCIFRDAPVQFRTTTAKVISRLNRKDQLTKLSDLCLANAGSLKRALETVGRLGIGAFRILSPVFPLYTHPDVGYALDELPESIDIREALRQVADYRGSHDLRLSLHPDQFIVLNSPRPEVVANAREELCYQNQVAELVGAEVINLHLGGVYGDKPTAIDRFIANFATLPETIRSRLSLENDDRCYTPSDLLPVSERTGIPVVYDVHHHRCNPDGLTVPEATTLCAATWQRQGREPYFHISSPRNGWTNGDPRPHSEYIALDDFPDEWRRLQFSFTVDVEAKAKELAVVRLMNDMGIQLFCTSTSR